MRRRRGAVDASAALQMRALWPGSRCDDDEFLPGSIHRVPKSSSLRSRASSASAPPFVPSPQRASPWVHRRHRDTGPSSPGALKRRYWPAARDGRRAAVGVRSLDYSVSTRRGGGGGHHHRWPILRPRVRLRTPFHSPWPNPSSRLSCPRTPPPRHSRPRPRPLPSPENPASPALLLKLAIEAENGQDVREGLRTGASGRLARA
ncbi:hypothetical protein C8R46DRAFT_1220654 [Mycena filopes]|nr:hypothetical protein C8R46DRAFT_1220654 [Mycena filopes]